ncbi:hypothetical protein PFICI_09404 [Pestalotiopsis fici W106-1]|uniref:Uncharacterized protein n=1 Tax=Pestalotiopsis fici (strain W106-1 / CGMCC3.15140) TaxID=1229662 RepID=W3X326_PESFW|nr:uncharacterized protein PFICI_09404 [Pestalotiopsis fici W106-1]ETS79551.1 hypothetical protein PFICI_09404 [Pestalotiopsis fici W106-1]
MATLKTISFLALLASSTVAVPFENAPEAVRSILKRTNPSIASDFTAQQKTQIEDALKDVISLSVEAVAALDDDDRDEIIENYFDEDDKDTVRDVYLKIMGDPDDPTNPDPTGNSMLGNIEIVKDYQDVNGDYNCDDGTMALLVDWSTDNPHLILCDLAFTHGGIDKGYDNVQKIDCDWVDDRVTWKIHFEKLVVPPLDLDVTDEEDGYGPVNTRKLDKDKALYNADSYAWYATEAFWTKHCDNDYGEPEDDDDKDPNCNDEACQDATA